MSTTESNWKGQELLISAIFQWEAAKIVSHCWGKWLNLHIYKLHRAANLRVSFLKTEAKNPSLMQQNCLNQASQNIFTIDTKEVSENVQIWWRFYSNIDHMSMLPKKNIIVHAKTSKSPKTELIDRPKNILIWITEKKPICTL